MHFLAGRIVIVLTLLFLTFASTRIFPQTPSGTSEAPVELQNEPHHQLKFENEYVRVWNTVIPAKSSTLWHAHRHDNIVLTLNDASVRVETVGAEPVETQPKLGDVGFRKATYVHRTMSVGDNPFHNMAIELLSTLPASQNAESLPEPAGSPAIDNERARVYRISLAPGESTGMQSRVLLGLEVSMTSGELEYAVKGDKKPESAKVDTGAVHWRSHPNIRSIKNVGKTRYEAVDIELKERNIK